MRVCDEYLQSCQRRQVNGVNCRPVNIWQVNHPFAQVETHWADLDTQLSKPYVM